MIDEQNAALRVSMCAGELALAVANLSYADRTGLLSADLEQLTSGFTDEERNALSMATAAVAAHLRVNPRVSD